MAEPLTVKSVYEQLHQYAQNRSDLGLRKAVADVVLEPASPFDSNGTRSPKRWFVLLALVATLVFGCFIFFNILR